MFGKRHREAAINTLVGADTRVQGDIEFSGGCLVDGYIKGNVRAAADEPASLSISERGCVEGTVAVPNVIINGTVKGDVRAAGHVRLGPRAKVMGNVEYKLIEMAVGAEVNGKLIHAGDGERAVAAKPSVEAVRAVKVGGEQV